MERDFSPANAAPVATETDGTPHSGVPAAGAVPDNENAAPTIDWEADDNPYKGRALEYETRLQRAARLEQENQQYRQAYAQAAAAAEAAQRQADKRAFQNGDIDAEEYDRRVNDAIARRDAMWQQTLTPYVTRDYADTVAQQHGLTAEEKEELYGLDGHAMDFAARQIVQRRNLVPTTEVQSLREELEQLRRSMAAGQIVASGATQTLGSNPSQQGATPPPGSPGDLRNYLSTYHPDLLSRRR